MISYTIRRHHDIHFFYILIYISLLVLQVHVLTSRISSRNQQLLEYEIKPFILGIGFLFRLYQTWLSEVICHSSDQSLKPNNRSINIVDNVLN